MGTKVSPTTLKYVETVGCSQDCDKIIAINQGVPLPCKEWTNEESSLLRERMLVDNQLFVSGFVRRVQGSTLGNSRRIRLSGLDVGPIKTQSNGASAVNECKVSFEGVRIKDFEKTFYVVNTEKNLQICTKDFIGTKWQDLIGGQMSNYSADEFADSDLADIIIAQIIERYNEFVPKFMLMATCDGSGENMHGDDGIMAKAYYASKSQYYHTLEFDLSTVETSYPNEYINAIVGGNKYDKAPDEFASAEQYVLDFVNWVNTRKEKRDYLFNASIDLTTDKMFVSANYVTRFVDLRIVLNDGSVVDWGCKSTMASELIAVELQKAMMINDTPLLFQYENIDENNFAQKFKYYKKEFKRYLHRNGFENITDADMLIGIDPELMLERNAQTENAFIGGNFNPNFMEEIGLTVSQFRPLNALNNTGLFFMTVRGNLLLLDDASNGDNTILNMGRIRFAEACDTPGLVNIFGGTPPIGSEVEHWGMFASNLTDSFFVVDNKLDNREPCENAKLNLICYDDNVKNECLIEATCSLSCSVDSVAVYDAGADETNITVTVNTNTPVGTTLVYDLAYSLSDGTGQTGITAKSFVITVPGDQTDDGLRLFVTGTVEAQILSETQCSTNVNYSEEFGAGAGYASCSATDTNDQAVNQLTDGLSVQYTIDGVAFNVALVNTALSYANTGDFADIESELEAIFPNTSVTLTDVTGDVQVDIASLPSFISAITITSSGTANVTNAFVIDCD